MNAVQFGRWFSERRRSSGWPSQRLLAEAAQQHTMVRQSNLSEDFLSRLEAGHLSHPFRGTVRRRILLLAWLLCRTPRDLKAYLKAAGLHECSDEENALLHLLNEHLTAQQTPPPLLLPARPAHLIGRSAEMAQIINALSNPETRIFALTGMPGVGKSALAYEALHQLATAESERLRHFPDGIATFTCTGRQGTPGLLSLLNEIIEIFASDRQQAQSHAPRRQRRRRAENETSALPFESEHTSELASTIDHARAVLANKRVLILLDDLDPAFPLRQASEVLLAQGAQTLSETRADTTQHEQRVILTTSQFVLSPALVSTHLHVQPLSEQAAIALLGTLIGTELDAPELFHARQACAAVGYLPLAIEGMATAIQAQSMPLDLVATYLATHPLGGLLDSADEMIAEMARALDSLETHMRADYLLLAALELPDFDLQTATAVLASPCQPRPDLNSSTLRRPAEAAGTARTTPLSGRTHRTALAEAELEHERLAHLAGTAAILGQFVRLSLLELVPGTPANDTHYHMHTLLYHYARTLTHTLSADCLETARQNLRNYTGRR